MLANLVDGKPAPDQEWYEFFVQLNGTILSLWDAEAVDQAAYMGGQSVMPQFINITDAIIKITNPQEHPEHFNVLSITTAGSNRYLFEFQSPNVLKRWNAAFRIAIYERAALQECYTAALIARARAAPNVKRLFSAYHGVLGSKGKYSGWVRVRFNWSLRWQKCWVVVSDTPSSWSVAGSGHGIHERLLYKFSSKQSLRGEARFYESRRDAKNKPIAVLCNVFAAYAVYPEKPFLVDSSTMIKVEGSLHVGRGASSRSGEQLKDAFILLMPDDFHASSSNTSSPTSSPVPGTTAPQFSNLPRSRVSSSSSFFSFHGSSSPKGTSSPAFESMLTWLVAFYDAFNLYGRPEKLITESQKQESMIFAMPSSLENSYLDVEDVVLALADAEQLENNVCTTREWRLKMKELTSVQLRQGKRAFNPVVLLNNVVAEVPVVRPPVPPHLRTHDLPNVPIRPETAPAVHFPVNYIESNNYPPMYPPPVAHRQSDRLSFLRRKPSRPEPGHKRSISENGVENTRVAINRFSLNEDSEDENDADIFQPRVAPPYQSSPLRHNDIRPSLADSDADFVDMPSRVGRPPFARRGSSHRRAHSETRMVEINREAEENYRREHNSDDESDSPQPAVARRVSSDDTLKVQSGAFLGINQGGLPGSRGSLETGTQFNRTFDSNARQNDEGGTVLRLSGSSSDRSDTLADPLRDTPRMGAAHVQGSPASSMESLPTSKTHGSPQRNRPSSDDRIYNAYVAPSEAGFNAIQHRDKSQPSVLVPVNGQPTPVRREPSPSRPPYAQGPRSPTWSAVPVSSSKSDEVLNYNQEILEPRGHLPDPVPTSGKFPPVLNYPVQPTAPRPQQFPGTSPEATYQQTIPDLQMRARGAPPSPHQQQRGPPVQDAHYAQNPRRSVDFKSPRRIIPDEFRTHSQPRTSPHPIQMNSPSAGPAYAQNQSSPPQSRSASPKKLSRYPQGPRQFASAK
jgi:hypothetical protein